MSEPAPGLFGLDLGELRHVQGSSLALRFAFGAAISVVAGLGGMSLGHVVGGMLLAFPAIAPATLTLIERDQGNAAAVHDVGGAVFGGVGLVGFAFVGTELFGTIPAPGVLLACLGAWTVVSVFLYVLRAENRLVLPGTIQRPGGDRR